MLIANNTMNISHPIVNFLLLSMTNICSVSSKLFHLFKQIFEKTRIIQINCLTFTQLLVEKVFIYPSGANAQFDQLSLAPYYLELLFFMNIPLNYLMINKIERLSEAFPPTSKNSIQYFSECHQLLQESTNLTQLTENDIILRRVENEKDIEQIKQLHKEWFPIPYSESYYEQIRKGSTQSIIAEFKLLHQSGKEYMVIVGALFYKIDDAIISYLHSGLKNVFNSFLMCVGMKNFKGLYIMTIGVVNEMRQKGVATKMIDKLKNIAFHSQNIKYIYLDMVSYNKAASRFYEKNQFHLQEIKKDHYFIEQKRYDSLVFIWFPQLNQ